MQPGANLSPQIKSGKAKLGGFQDAGWLGQPGERGIVMSVIKKEYKPCIYSIIGRGTQGDYDTIRRAGACRGYYR